MDECNPFEDDGEERYIEDGEFTLLINKEEDGFTITQIKGSDYGEIGNFKMTRPGLVLDNLGTHPTMQKAIDTIKKVVLAEIM